MGSPSRAPMRVGQSACTTQSTCGRRTTHMFKRIRQRLDGNKRARLHPDRVLVVIIIIGILLAIAVPSYLGFRDRAAKSAAQANVRSATPGRRGVLRRQRHVRGHDASGDSRASTAGRQASTATRPASGRERRGDGYCIQSDSDGSGAGTSKPARVHGAGRGRLARGGNLRVRSNCRRRVERARETAPFSLP